MTTPDRMSGNVWKVFVNTVNRLKNVEVVANRTFANERQWKRPYCRLSDVTQPIQICVIKRKDKPMVVLQLS